MGAAARGIPPAYWWGRGAALGVLEETRPAVIRRAFALQGVTRGEAARGDCGGLHCARALTPA